jgi:hypothetical protein
MLSIGHASDGLLVVFAGRNSLKVPFVHYRIPLKSSSKAKQGTPGFRIFGELVIHVMFFLS